MVFIIYTSNKWEVEGKRSALRLWILLLLPSDEKLSCNDIYFYMETCVVGFIFISFV